MTYRTLFFHFLLSMLCFITYLPTTAGMYNQGGMPNMQDFEKELEEANKAIEEYVASLPAEEQALFNQSVADMAAMFENMSEEEFEKFLGEMFTEEQMMMESNPFETAQPVAPEVAEVVLSAEDKKKVETAITILDNIIRQSNLFMVIISSSPDLPNRIDRWALKQNISNWQEGTTWNQFKTTLEEFIQKIYRVEEQDPITKKYKYLLELIADEALYNNLIQLQTELNALVPSIAIPEFGIQKLSAQSKTAIKNILQKYTESFYLLTVPKSLDALFEKYAPEAEKLRVAEEAATKKALEASRVPRTPAEISEAGMEPEMGYGYDSGYGYGDYYGGGYNPYDSGYSGYGGGYGDYGYSPDYGSYGSDHGSTSGGSKGGRGEGGAGGRGESGEKKEKTEEDKEKEEKNKKNKQFTPEYEIERAIADIKTGLDEIKTFMFDKEKEEKGETTKLANLTDIVTKEEAVDVILAGATLKTVDKKVATIDEALKAIDKKKLNAEHLAHYQLEVKKAFEKNKKYLEALRDSINMFTKKTDEELVKEAEEKAKKAAVPGAPAEVKKQETTDISTLTNKAQKQWAYFGGNADLLADDEETKKLKEAVESPVSLFEIKKNIDQLLKDLDTFEKKKAKVVVEKKEAAAKPDLMPELPE